MDLYQQKRIGPNFKYLRIISSYTQNKLSASLNISTDAYRSYENGSQMPPVNVLCDLSLLYGVPVGVILEANKEDFAYKVALHTRKSEKLKRVIEIYKNLPLIKQGMLVEYAEILLSSRMS